MFGVTDEVSGEACAALVVRRGEVGEDELVEWVNRRTEEEWRRIRRVKFVEELPHNSVGKKMRRKMKEMWEIC